MLCFEQSIIRQRDAFNDEKQRFKMYLSIYLFWQMQIRFFKMSK